MVFKNNIPTQTTSTSIMARDLHENNISLNASFGTDHFPFDDTTDNNGKHNVVQTPLIVGAVHPTTAANEPKLYAMQDSVPFGNLNYSRGASNAVPTPLTYIQSDDLPIAMPSTGPGKTINILDFTGINRAIFHATAANFKPTEDGGFGRNYAFCIWNGSTFLIKNTYTTLTPNPQTFLTFISAGSILQLSNTTFPAQELTQVFWSLNFSRIE